MFYAFLGYILIPFVALWGWLKDSMEGMTENQKLVFIALFIFTIGFVIQTIGILGFQAIDSYCINNF